MVEFIEKEEETVLVQEVPSHSSVDLVENRSNEVAQLIPSDEFRLLEFIGEGGMAEVFKVESKIDGSIKAVKVLKAELLRERNAAKRFLKECEAIQELSHENIVQISGTGVLEDGRPYLLLEFIDGRTLKELLRSEGHLSVVRSVRIARQIADALAQAHAKGIVHRDLKPSNILICQQPDGTDLVRVVDFGIAKTKTRSLSETADLTKTGDIFGSPEYMSVEQCLGNPIDHRSDIYSFGCVLYEMLTGRSPFASDSPIKSILKHVEDEAEPFALEHSKLEIPKELEQLVFDCLQKDPEHRTKSASWLAQRLSSMSELDADPFRFDLLSARVVATAVDFILVSIFAWLFTSISHWLLPQSDPFVSKALMTVVGLCVYKGWMESGNSRATFAMQGVELKACDSAGGIIDFWRAFACPYVMLSVPMGIFGLVLHNTLLLPLVKDWICPVAFLLAVVSQIAINYFLDRRLTKGGIAHNHRKSPRFAYSLNRWQTRVLLISTWLYYLYFDAAFHGSTALFW